MDYSRIEQAIDIHTLENTHIVIVGAGGSYNLVINLARCGVGKLTVLDFDTVEASNIVRQGYSQHDIGKYKVEALEEKVQAINPHVNYTGITKNFLSMSDQEQDAVFGFADMFLFLTDSFSAQSFGNILALRYKKPALWGGWYALSRTAEIFFQVPNDTPACFRCAVSPRYELNAIAEAQDEPEISISSHANTIFHSELLDSYIGMLVMAMLHRNHINDELEFVSLYQSLLDDDGVLRYNFLQFKVHPLGGNPLFDEAYGRLGKTAQLFTPIWQRINPELVPEYEEDCPDCNGVLNVLVQKCNL